jgi:hypothetical protein
MVVSLILPRLIESSAKSTQLMNNCHCVQCTVFMYDLVTKHEAILYMCAVIKISMVQKKTLALNGRSMDVTLRYIMYL